MEIFKAASLFFVSIFGVATAVFKLMDTYLEENQLPIQTWLGEKWILLEESHWITLPRKTFELLFNLKGGYFIFLKGVRDSCYFSCSFLIGMSFILITIVGFISSSINESFESFLMMFSVLFIAPITVVSLILRFFVRFPREEQTGCGFEYFFWASVHYTVLLFMPYVVITLLPLNAATIFMLAISPCICLGSGALLNRHNENTNINIYIGSFFTFSFIATFASFWIGLLCNPGDKIPQIPQLIFVNVVFDTCTIAITFVLTKKMVYKGGIWIAWGLVFDIISACFLSVSSLYIGLYGTSYHMSILETLYTFAGLSVDGGKWEFGSRFWTMNTSLIPSVFYVSFLFVLCCGKLVVSIFAYLLGKGYESERPMNLAAAFTALLTAISMAPYLLANFIRLTIQSLP